MQLPRFNLPTADGGRLSNEDLAGQPWFIYAARHPGCFVCQHALKDALALRSEVQQLGGDIVVFFNAKPEYTRHWVENSDLPRDLTVVIDPDAAFYEELGTVRGTMADQLRHSVGLLWRARSNIANWRLTPNDMMRMGADVAVAPDGEISFSHICRNPEDRADPRTIVDSLRSVAA